MSSDEKKNWGTIFLDATRESSLSKIDAMQAASRQEQWNKKTQQDYLEKVRQKAIDRAKEILGEAYTERQNILAEAEQEAERIRNEAKATYAAAEDIRNQSQELRHSVQAELDDAMHIKEGAHEEGFQAGLEQAQEELQNFRAAMGSSVAGVLHVIESQSMNIFLSWRAELVDLLRICVEKGTGIVLQDEHKKILESMMYGAVRNLDDRRSVTLRVNPEDEAVVTDLIAAAKESNPDLGQWETKADSSLQPGDLIAESTTGTVESRLDLFRHMVENILQHMNLPEGEVDLESFGLVKRVVEIEVDKVAAVTPPMIVHEEESSPEEEVVEENLPELIEESVEEEMPELEEPQEPLIPMTPEQMAFQMQLQKAENVPSRLDLPQLPQDFEEEDASQAPVADVDGPREILFGSAGQETEEETLTDMVQEAEHVEQRKNALASTKNGLEPSMEELEDELLGDDAAPGLDSLDDFAAKAPSLDDFADGPSLDDFADGPSLDDFANAPSLDDFSGGDAPSLDSFASLDSLEAANNDANFDDMLDLDSLEDTEGSLDFDTELGKSK